MLTPLRCAEFVKGCDLCLAEQAELDNDHECGQMCKIWGESRRKSDEFHALTHEPQRCEQCRAVIKDLGMPDRSVIGICISGYCTVWSCPDCGSELMSEGPIGCPSCGSLPRRLPRVSRLRRMYRQRSRGRR